jgi:hypothetical protein
VPQSPCVSMHLAPSTHDRHLLQSASAAAAASASSAVALACPTCTALACSSASRAFATSAASGLQRDASDCMQQHRLHLPLLVAQYSGLPPSAACGFFSVPSSCCNSAVTASICLPQRLPSHMHLKSHDGRYLGKGDRCLMSLAMDRWQTRGS